MEAIQIHPFFTRKSPRTVERFEAPPTPDVIQRPVARVEDIDPDILNNLKTLWHGLNETEIIESLVSKE